MNFQRTLGVFARVLFVAAVAAIAVATGILTNGTTLTGQQAMQTSPVNSAEIVKLRDQWTKDLHAKQLDQIAALYTEDAEFLLPNGTRVSGRPAIRELCKNVMATMTSDITLRTATSERSGNLAYDSGDFSETLTAVSDGKKSQSTGNYVMIFRRQANGTWLIAEQVWTGVLPDIH